MRPGPTNKDILVEPMVQIPCLNQGRLAELPPPSPVPALPLPPAGWYADRLRLWNGRSWTSEIHPIGRPSPAMRAVYEVVDGAEPASTTRPVALETAGPPEVGLLGMPPTTFEPATRISSEAREIKSGLISGLMSGLAVVGAAIAAVALLAAIEIVLNL